MSYAVPTTEEEAVRDHMGLVRKVISKHFPAAVHYGASMDDLEAIGAIGLVKAFRKFDPSRGGWSTCAFTWVRGTLSLNLKSYGHTTETALKASDGRWNHIRFSDFSNSIEETPIFCDKPSQADAIIDRRLILAKVAASLPKREVDILWSRSRGETLDEIGVRYGVTRENIRQIEGRALLKARVIAERMGYDVGLSPKRRLTRTTVEVMRKHKQRDNWNYKQLARQYGTTVKTVKNALYGYAGYNYGTPLVDPLLEKQEAA